MLLRTIFLGWLSRRRSKLDVHDVGRVNLRVLPNDIDVLRHMNNGVYLSVMDLGRLDLLTRTGMLRGMTARGFYPVVASETISFRRSLQPRQRYTLETRIVGYDDRAVYVEQRFVAGGEIYAVGFVRGRFLKRTGGTVSMQELGAALGVDTATLLPPAWVHTWAADVALPSNAGSYTSDWV